MLRTSAIIRSLFNSRNLTFILRLFATHKVLYLISLSKLSHRRSPKLIIHLLSRFIHRTTLVQNPLILIPFTILHFHTIINRVPNRHLDLIPTPIPLLVPHLRSINAKLVNSEPAPIVTKSGYVIPE